MGTMPSSSWLHSALVKDSIIGPRRLSGQMGNIVDNSRKRTVQITKHLGERSDLEDTKTTA